MSSEDKRSVPGEFDVIDADLPHFVGDYQQMDYGDPLAERTVQVLDEYRLHEVVEGHPTELDAMLALKRWVRSRWDHGWSRRFKEVEDALDILRAAEEGEQFNCGFYTRVFVKCARALGWVARPVGVSIAACSTPRGPNVGNVGHSVPEIWSNQLRKWVIMDPDMNLHYLRDGVPLSALEIHNAWLSGDAEQVEAVQDQPEFVVPQGPCVQIVRELMPQLPDYDARLARLNSQRFSRHRVLDYYARLRIGKWEWLDARCLPTFVSHFSPGGGLTYTSNPDDLYWTVNMVRLSAKASWEGEPKLAVAMEHCMPWFSHYGVRLDAGDWERREDSFDWLLHEGHNSLQVRGVNLCGQPGITSSLQVAFSWPRW